MNRPFLAALVTCLALALACLAQPADDLPPPVPTSRPTAAAADLPRRPPPPAAPLRPYTAFCWSDLRGYPHLRPLLWFDQMIPLGELAKRSALIERGSRVYLNLVSTRHLQTDPRDVLTDADGRPTHARSLWHDHGAAAVRARWAERLNWYADAGGQVDFMALDYEYGNSCWSLDPDYMRALKGDPRWPALGRELQLDDPAGALWRPENNGEYLRWNALLERWRNDALDASIFVPLRRRFPRAGMSNFGAYNQTPEHAVPDVNGHAQHTAGDPCGTHQSPAFYGGARPHALDKVAADFERPFVQVVYAANYARGCARSTAMPQLPWVAFRGFLADGTRPMFVGGTDYWQELVCHVMLSGGTDNLIYWNPKEARLVVEGRTITGIDPGDHQALEGVLADAERAAGGQRIVAPAITAATPWDAKFLISGGRLADGSMLLRVTFAEGQDAAGLRVGERVMRVERPAGQLGTWVRLPK